MIIRRTLIVIGATFVAMALAASAAFAHQCYNASRSDTGNVNAEKGQALSSFDELLDELCTPGDEIVQTWVDDNNFDTDGILVNVHALMGGGAQNQGKKTTDGHDIDYLPGGLLAAIGQAFGTCFGGA